MRHIVSFAVRCSEKSGALLSVGACSYGDIDACRIVVEWRGKKVYMGLHARHDPELKVLAHRIKYTKVPKLTGIRCEQCVLLTWGKETYKKVIIYLRYLDGMSTPYFFSITYGEIRLKNIKRRKAELLEMVSILMRVDSRIHVACSSYHPSAP